MNETTTLSNNDAQANCKHEYFLTWRKDTTDAPRLVCCLCGHSKVYNIGIRAQAALEGEQLDR